jgi:N-acetylglucosaminyl-diphospho-decaprenol L-rhamnosyltransferase
MTPHDLAIIIVSTNEARWLEPCLRTVIEHAGDIAVDLVVVDNDSTDGTRECVESNFPVARVVRSRNKGFAHANNRGAMTCDARYVLFLNPDTEIVSGSFADLVAALDDRPQVGLIGVRQLTADGTLWPTVRYFPGPARAAADALGCEHWPRRLRGRGERELRMERYDRELICDWTSGSFMLTRREALLSAGLLDERFFIYSEEPDLCLRLKRAGWEMRHLPAMTIIHHAGKGGVRPRMIAQDVYTRRQYARKHLSPTARPAYLSAVFARHAIRAVVPGGREDAVDQRVASRQAMKTLLGRVPPPFGEPPAVAVAQVNVPRRGAPGRRISP